MRICEFIEHLKMFPDEMQVFIRTSSSDLAQPVNRNLISLIPATHCERYGLEQAKLLLTAYEKYKEGGT